MCFQQRGKKKKEKKRRTPSDCLERDRNTVGREDNPQRDKLDAVSHFKIQHNPIRGWRRSDVSDSPPVGERALQRHRFFEDPSAGIQICEPDQLKSFPLLPQPEVKTQSLSHFPGPSQSDLAACSGSGSVSVSSFSLPDATGAHNVHQCVCVFERMTPRLDVCM